VPCLGIFFGISFYMYFRDHAPPHVHAEYQGEEAEIAIATGEFLEGSLPPGAARRAKAWVRENEAMLVAKWEHMNPSQERK
jgi:Domain of unknown function (DUF4160)